MAVTKFEKQVADILRRENLTGNIRFSLLGRKVFPAMFQRVAKGITDDKIQVRWVDKHSKIPGDGRYDHKTNTFYIRDTTADPGDLYSLLVHEAVHAHSDIVGEARDPWPEEAIATIAGCACLYNMGRAKDATLKDL